MKILTNREVPKEVLDAIMNLATDMAAEEETKGTVDMTIKESDESSIAHVSTVGEAICCNPIETTKEKQKLMSGFIKAGINPFTGEKLDLGMSPLFESNHRILDSVGDMMAEYKKAPSSASYQPIHPADLTAIRNTIRHAFASYAYNAFNQVINYANFDFSERIKAIYSPKEFEFIDDIIFGFRGSYPTNNNNSNKIFYVFDIDEITSFSPELNTIYSYGGHGRESLSVFSGALLDLGSYMAYDLGTILLMIIPIMETSYNKFFNKISVNKEYFENLLRIYNESQTILIVALENVISMLYREAIIYINAGGPGLIDKYNMDPDVSK